MPKRVTVMGLGRFGGGLGAIPDRRSTRIFQISAEDVERSIAAAGFAIDQQWRPAKSMAVFIVAKKVV